MQKVILSAYACSPIRGTEPGNGWTWAFYLAKAGYEVWCFTNFEDRDAIEKKTAEIKLENLHFVFVTLPYNLDKLINAGSKGIYLHYYLWGKFAARKAIKLHKEINFEIAHHVTFGSLQQGSFLWKLTGAKYIFGPAGGGQEALPAFKEYFGKAWKTELIRNKLSKLSFKLNPNLKQTLRRANHILVTNKETENLIRSTKFYDSSRVHLVLDNAVPPAMEGVAHTDHTYSGKLKLLWVGRMLPRKGLNLVLHALSFIPPDVDYVLTIVGGGECFKNLDEWIDQYKIKKEKLNILGQIPFVEVIDHYKISDVFVFCSLRDSCPAQLNEAMAFGLPPVVLNIHGSALAVPDDCGIKVEAVLPEQTAKGIAAAITRLYYDRELLKRLSENSYEYARKNTWAAKVSVVTSSYYM